MLLKIDDNLQVIDIQEKFNECFPYLKIEFYDEVHGWHKPSGERHQINARYLLERVRHKHDSGVLEIKSSYKTGKVEQDFRHLFGLNVQIYRLQQNTWVQTTGTDDLTLQQQSDLARASMPAHAPERFVPAEENDEEVSEENYSLP